ncbi:helix-turn-helix domain-containing protein, partial [Clostridium neonatale]
MKYYTVSEVAKKYKVSKETIYKRIREGVISRARNKGNVIR